MENATRINKKKMRMILYVFIAVILVLVFSSRTLYNLSLPRVTVTMTQSGWITKELEVRGAVEFSETFDVFAPFSGWIDEIFINRGDFIDVYSIIASYNPATANEQVEAGLLTNIERIEHQLARLNIQREDIQSNLRALSSSPNDLLQLQWTVDDAQTNLENRKAELIQAQQQLEDSIQDSFTHIDASTDAERDWNRRVTELNQAQAVLHDLEARGSNFDDFTYMQAIYEASIALERRTADLLNAEASLDDARSLTAATFDARNYQNVINAAQINHQRNQLAYDSAYQQLNAAWHRLHTLSIYADLTEIIAIHTAINEAQNQVALARIMLDESNAIVGQASDNLQRARNTFNAQDREQRNQAEENAEIVVIQAENAFADATRAYEHAHALLSRAEDAAIARWQSEINEAVQRIDDALIALDESIWKISQNLRQAESNLADAYQVLERAEKNLDLAQRAQTAQANDTRRAFEIELRNIDLDIERTKIDLRADLSSLAIMHNSHETTILANRQGIVVSVDKREGQFVSQGERIATMGADNNRFMIEFSATILDADFIEIGSEARIYRSGSNIGVHAFVYDMTLIGDILNIRLISETDQFSGGEFTRVRFRKQTGPHQTIVPNEAVFAGTMGQHYIWTLQSRPGTLGTEHISTRRTVRIIDSDDFNTAIYMGFIMMDMPVIISHSRELSVNGRVSRME